MTETPIFDALRQSRPLPKVDDASNSAAERLTKTLEELAKLGRRGPDRSAEAADERPGNHRTGASVTSIPRQVDRQADREADKEQTAAEAPPRAAAVS